MTRDYLIYDDYQQMPAGTLIHPFPFLKSHVLADKKMGAAEGSYQFHES